MDNRISQSKPQAMTYGQNALRAKELFKMLDRLTSELNKSADLSITIESNNLNQILDQITSTTATGSREDQESIKQVKEFQNTHVRPFFFNLIKEGGEPHHLKNLKDLVEKAHAHGWLDKESATNFETRLARAIKRAEVNQAKAEPEIPISEPEAKSNQEWRSDIQRGTKDLLLELMDFAMTNEDFSATLRTIETAKEKGFLNESNQENLKEEITFWKENTSNDWNDLGESTSFVQQRLKNLNELLNENDLGEEELDFSFVVNSLITMKNTIKNGLATNPEEESQPKPPTLETQKETQASGILQSISNWWYGK
jgi:hypothetical protein